MSDRKPCKTENQVLLLALQKVRPQDIAVRINRAPATVYHYLRKARREGHQIPPFTRGPNTAAVVAIPANDKNALRVSANRRGMTVQELVQQLVRVVVRDSLVTAILDDGKTQS